ncbi:MAG TPA: hypothetical protein VMH23_19720 [Bacteroidota bacterium]|nr:hypothetical protein [Bacteroidota bacterium]
MKELMDKLTSYNLFNYLLPGVIFVVISKELLGRDFSQENILLGGFLYYFIGMVISRIGSLIIEPILKKVSFLKFADYGNYVTASKKDEKIDLLSEVNNSYRTIVALFVSLLSLRGYVWCSGVWPVLSEHHALIATVFCLAIFLFSYRKQSDYVRKRVDAASNR